MVKRDTPPASPRLEDEIEDDSEENIEQDGIEVIDLDDLEPDELEQEFQVIAGGQDHDEDSDEMEASGGLEVTREDNSVLFFHKHESNCIKLLLIIRIVIRVQIE
jgi:hypothetical protein